MTLRRSLAFAAGVIFSSSLHASDLVPFDVWNKENPNWQIRELDSAYVFTRCGALIFSIGVFLERNSDGGKSTGISRSNIQRESNLSLRAIPLYKKNGVTGEFVEMRTKALMNAYFGMMQENAVIHNRFLYGFTLSDLKFCEEVESLAR